MQMIQLESDPSVEIKVREDVVHLYTVCPRCRGRGDEVIWSACGRLGSYQEIARCSRCRGQGTVRRLN